MSSRSTFYLPRYHGYSGTLRFFQPPVRIFSPFFLSPPQPSFKDTYISFLCWHQFLYRLCIAGLRNHCTLHALQSYLFSSWICRLVIYFFWFHLDTRVWEQSVTPWLIQDGFGQDGLGTRLPWERQRAEWEQSQLHTGFPSPGFHHACENPIVQTHRAELRVREESVTKFIAKYMDTERSEELRHLQLSIEINVLFASQKWSGRVPVSFPEFWDTSCSTGINWSTKV